MKKHIPNILTCCNLTSGCLAAYFAFQNDFLMALVFIITGATFDFSMVRGASASCVVAYRQGTRFAGRRHYLWFCAFGHCVFSTSYAGFARILRGRLPAEQLSADAVHSFSGFSHRFVLGIAFGQVQSGRTTDVVVHRTAHAG